VTVLLYAEPFGHLKRETLLRSIDESVHAYSCD